MNDVPHSDNTTAFVYARAQITNDLAVLMDASKIIPCPGDPDDDSYQDSVPVSGKASHLRIVRTTIFSAITAAYGRLAIFQTPPVAVNQKRKSYCVGNGQ